MRMMTCHPTLDSFEREKEIKLIRDYFQESDPVAMEEKSYP